MDDLEIRPALSTDAADIAALWNWMILETQFTFTSIPKSITDVANWMDLRVSQGFPVLVLYQNGFAGFASYGPFRNGDGYTISAEHTILLSAQTRGTGLAQRAMARLEALACENGIETLIGGFSATNTRALRFHEKIGYCEVARIPHIAMKQGHPQTLILLQKNLSS